MMSKLFFSLVALSFLAIVGCSGATRTTGAHYGYRYGPDPWYYRGGYVRDRVHVVSGDEIRALEELDSPYMPEPSDSSPDMGFGDMDMDFGGADLDF